jgi:hypothetical protein
MMRTLLLMLALIAAFIPQQAPLRAAPATDMAMSCHQPAAPQPADHGAPVPDRHICIGCAIPSVAAPLPGGSSLAQSRPLGRIAGLGAVDAPALDPPPPRGAA